jgi:LPS export ABC transporter protein LptC
MIFDIRFSCFRTIFIIVSIFFVVVACTNEDKPDKIGAITDRSAMPRLHETEITTIISDSGITRYRMTTPRWDIYDKATQPHWEFPKGIYFEQFDKNLKIITNIQSQHARYYENEKLWDLRGKVKMTNVQGQLFETEQLLWNQIQEKFYSDSLIKITEPTRIIKGIGFESNQAMTHYTIRKIQGIFPVDEKAK